LDSKCNAKPGFTTQETDNGMQQLGRYKMGAGCRCK